MWFYYISKINPKLFYEAFQFELLLEIRTEFRKPSA